MSPEQAKGREADRRSDVWAFGCVLYEMLTGTRLFGGQDISDTMAFVLTRAPDWTALPPATPSAIRRLLRRALEKDRRRRLPDIADARLEIEEALAMPADVALPAAAAGPRPRWRRAVIPALTLVIGAAGAGAAVWVSVRPAPPRVSRTTITPTGTAALTISGFDRDIAITPDASRVVYVGNNGTQLFVRALDTLEPEVLASGALRGPFVSPDGQWVGFVDNNTTLQKVALTGGPPVTLTRIDGAGIRGATWAADDTIIFATNNVATGLQRVSACGLRKSTRGSRRRNPLTIARLRSTSARNRSLTAGVSDVSDPGSAARAVRPERASASGGPPQSLHAWFSSRGRPRFGG
jgi:serine/threonine-protein kinase